MATSGIGRPVVLNDEGIRTLEKMLLRQKRLVEANKDLVRHRFANGEEEFLMDGYEDRLVGDPLEVDDDGVDETEDSLTFANGVIEKIIALGLHDIPNIAGMSGTLLNRVKDAFGMSDAGRGVSIVMLPDGDISVSVSVIMVYGAYAPQIFEDVKEAILRAMDEMTGLTVKSVDLRIEDVLTPEEISERSHRHLLVSASDDVMAES